MSTDQLSCTLPLPANYRPQELLSFHARDPLAISESVVADQLRKGIVWNGAPACLTLRFLPRAAEISVSSDPSDALLDREALSAMAVRMLGLDQPIDVFEARVGQHPQLGELLKRQSGLRVPVTPTAFEALTWAIIGQQISVSAALSIRRRFIRLIGLRHSGGLYCYPGANQITNVGIDDLRQAGLSPSKAQTLMTVSQMVIAGELELNLSQVSPPLEKIGQTLLKVRGIGPWTVNYALLRGFGFLDGSLHGDAAVRRGLKRLLNLDEAMDENQVRQWLEPFSPWRALVATHLWELASVDE